MSPDPLSPSPSPPPSGLSASPHSPLHHGRVFWFQFSSLCAVLAASEAARGVVLPTLSLYVASLGGSSLYLGLVVAAFSVGRLTSSLVFGFASGRVSLRLCLLGSIGLSVVGHVLFVLPPYASSSTSALVLLAASRVLTGFATGTLSLARAFTSAHTAASERTRFMAWLGVVQFAGYAFTPILGGLPVDWTVAGAWVITTYTAGTYALIVLDVLLLLALGWGMPHVEPEKTPPALAPVRPLKELGTDDRGRWESLRVRARRPPYHRGYLPVTESDAGARSEAGGEEEREGEDESTISIDVVVDRPEAMQKEEADPPRSHTPNPNPALTPSLSAAGSASLPASPRAPAPHVVRSQSLVASPAVQRTVNAVAIAHGRRSSAPAFLDVRPIRRSEESTSSLASIASQDPSLIRESWKAAPLFTPVLFVCLNATCRGCLAVAETYGSSLYYTTQYGAGYNPSTVSTTSAAWFFTALGGVGVVVFVLMDFFTRHLTDVTLLCWGFIAMSLGFLTTLDSDSDLSIYSLSFSMAMIYCIATPVCQTLVASMLSKSLPAAQQGKWMGLLTAAGSIGRIVFPLLAGAMYSLWNTNAALLLPAVLSLLAVFTIGLGMRAWKGWWHWMREVEERAEGKVGLWWERRKAQLDDGWAPVEDDEALEDAWLTIDQVMARMTDKANRKHRERRRARQRRSGEEEADEEERRLEERERRVNGGVDERVYHLAATPDSLPFEDAVSSPAVVH